MPNLALDLRYLRCALCAAEHGSFRRAAAVLALPQSTVSRRIMLLERQIGFPLFVRDRRGARLTNVGASFLQEASIGARRLDQAAQLALGAYRRQRGELRIAIVASLANGLLSELFRCFHERYSHVRISFSERVQSDALHGLAMGEFDISFVSGRAKMPGHTSRVLWHDSIYAVLPAGHRLAMREQLTWADLRHETFVVSRSAGAELQDCMIDRLSCPGFDPTIDAHDVSRDRILDLVTMAYGITIIRSSQLAEDVDGLAFRPIAGEHKVLPSSAVWLATNDNPALKHLLALAEKLGRDPSGKVSQRFARTECFGSQVLAI